MHTTARQSPLEDTNLRQDDFGGHQVEMRATGWIFSSGDSSW